MKRATYILLYIILSFSEPVRSQSTSLVDSLQRAIQSASEDSNKVKLLNALSWEEIHAGRYQVATDLSSEALALSRKVSYKRGMAASLGRLGVISERQRNFEEAMRYQMESLKVKEEIGDKNSIAVSYQNIGLIHLGKGSNGEAKKYFQMSLALREETGDRKGTADCYNNLGSVYMKEANLTEALKNFLISLKIKEETGNKRGAASSLQNIGVVYLRQGNQDEALSTYRLALKLFQALGDRKSVADCYNNIGIIHLNKQNFQEALNNYELSLAIRKEIGVKDMIAESNLNMGAVQEAIGDQLLKANDTIQANKFFLDARKSYDEALKIKEETNNISGRAICTINLGNNATKRRAFDEARRLIARGMELAHSSGNAEDMAIGYLKFTHLDSVQASHYSTPDSLRDQYWQSAYFNFLQYSDYEKKFLNEESIVKTAEFKMLYETERKDREIDVLSKDNEIKNLMVAQHQAMLAAAALEADKKKNLIELMAQTEKLQSLELKRQKDELERRQLEARVKEKELHIADKESQLQTAELGRQKWLNNFQAIIMVLILISTFMALYRFRQMQLKKQEAQRTRIARDLHDDLGATLSSISIFSAAANQKLRNKDDDEAGKLLERIASESQEMSSVLSDFVWTLNPDNDTIEKIADRMQSFASPVLSAKDIRMNFTTEDALKKISLAPEIRKNLFLIFKEAVNNAAKYSGAQEVQISLKSVDSKSLRMVIADNGTGFRMNGSTGNGLKNMNERAKEINATLGINSGQAGTEVNVTLTA